MSSECAWTASSTLPLCGWPGIDRSRHDRRRRRRLLLRACQAADRAPAVISVVQKLRRNMGPIILSWGSHIANHGNPLGRFAPRHAGRRMGERDPAGRLRSHPDRGFHRRRRYRMGLGHSPTMNWCGARFALLSSVVPGRKSAGTGARQRETARSTPSGWAAADPSRTPSAASISRCGTSSARSRGNRSDGCSAAGTAIACCRTRRS